MEIENLLEHYSLKVCKMSYRRTFSQFRDVSPIEIDGTRRIEIRNVLMQNARFSDGRRELRDNTIVWYRAIEWAFLINETQEYKAEIIPMLANIIMIRFFDEEKADLFEEEWKKHVKYRVEEGGQGVANNLTF